MMFEKRIGAGGGNGEVLWSNQTMYYAEAL
jgi:hypothetical protein